MLDLLSSALGGGSLGVLLRIGNGLFDNFKAGQDHKRKLEEMQVLAQIGSDKARWEAFTASQQAATPPANVSPWAANLITLFRPFITITLVLIATVIYFYSTTEAQSSTADQLNFAAFNCIGWWFGDRMSRKK